MTRLTLARLNHTRSALVGRLVQQALVRLVETVAKVARPRLVATS
jgi:hypothetical protein